MAKIPCKVVLVASSDKNAVVRGCVLLLSTVVLYFLELNDIKRGVIMKTLSEDNDYYFKLEEYIENKFFSYSNTTQISSKHDYIANLINNDKDFLSSKIEEAAGGDKELAKILKLSLDEVSILPTKYDDKSSYSLASKIMNEVIDVAKILDLGDQSNYGGYCCVPTGRVGAIAAPIIIPSRGTKVFVIFESGLFTFIHGVISILINAAPLNLLQGKNGSEWRLAWENHFCDNKYSEFLTEVAYDLKAWKDFFKYYQNRFELTYSTHRSFGENGKHLIFGMVQGCEYFIAAHEYCHAILKHQNMSLDSRIVEKEADMWGIRITYLLCKKYNIPMPYAIAGIAVFIKMTDTGTLTDYLPASERITYIIDSIGVKNSVYEKNLIEISELMQQILNDLEKKSI